MSGNAEAIIKTLSIQNPFTQEQVYEGIRRWPKTLDVCLKRANVITHLKKELHLGDNGHNVDTALHLEKITRLSTTLEPLLREATPVELEGYGQVIFQGNPWSSINFIPFALLILSFYKSYIVPAFGVILPLLSWILPYLLLITFYNIPITFSQYTGVLWRMWNGQPMPRMDNPEAFINLPPPPQEDAMTQLRRLAQNGWTLFTLGQALWHPIQQARHFIKLDGDCLELGKSIAELRTTATELVTSWGKFFPSWLDSWIKECPADIRQGFAFVLETPIWLPHLFRALGRFEVLYILANRADVVPTEFVASAEPILMIRDFGDPSIPSEQRVLSSARLGGKNSVKHAVLTGPNRGGKSSYMRGILTNILLSHAFGCCFAGKAQMTHFSWIANGLRLDDTPGEKSMFEREVSFSSGIIQKTDGRGIVLYDELFHSTNPPDAIRSSEIFCGDLWKKNNCLSIVSTHVYGLALQAPPTLVKPICVAAWKTGDTFKFSYNVQKGVCQVSSVDLVLKQYGLRLL
jgi:hypothetical protein